MIGAIHMKNNLEILLYALEKLRAEIKKLKIILIANSKDTPLSQGTNSKDIWIEFFNENEIEYLTNSLRKNGLYVDVYFSEQKFLQDILSYKYTDLNQLFVFNLARNGFGIGKKSLIPSFCDLMNIKYSGSDAYVCSLARNKFHCSKLLENFDCAGTPSWLYDSTSGWLLNEPPQNTQVIIKPMFESASKGITENSIIDTSHPQFMNRVVTSAIRSAQPMLVQKFIKGYECQIPFIKLHQHVFLQPTGISIDSQYELGNKIISEDLSYIYSYDYYDANLVLDELVCENLHQIAEKASNVIGINTYGRIDFRIDCNMTPYITDIATMPYIIEHSAFFHAFSSMGLSSEELLLSIICSALINKYHYVV